MCWLQDSVYQKHFSTYHGFSEHISGCTEEHLSLDLLPLWPYILNFRIFVLSFSSSFSLPCLKIETWIGCLSDCNILALHYDSPLYPPSNKSSKIFREICNRWARQRINEMEEMTINNYILILINSMSDSEEALGSKRKACSVSRHNILCGI